MTIPRRNTLVTTCFLTICCLAQAGGRISPSLRITDVALVGDEIQLVAQAGINTRGPAIFGGPTSRLSNVHDYFLRFRLSKDPRKPPEWAATHEILSAKGTPFGDRNPGTYLLGFAPDRLVRIDGNDRERIELIGIDPETKHWKILAVWRPKGRFLISQSGRYLILDPAKAAVLDLATMKEADAKTTPQVLPLFAMKGVPGDTGVFHLFDRKTGTAKPIERRDRPDKVVLSDGRSVGGKPLFLGTGELVGLERSLVILDDQGKVLHEKKIPSQSWHAYANSLAGDTLLGPAPKRAVILNVAEHSVQIWDYQAGALEKCDIPLLSVFERLGLRFVPKKG
jgi:hypothetical protein